MKYTIAAATLAFGLGHAHAARVTSIDIGTLDDQVWTFHQSIFPQSPGPFAIYFYFSTPKTETIAIDTLGPGLTADAWLQITGGETRFGKLTGFDNTTDVFVPEGPVVDTTGWDGRDTLGAGNWWVELSGTNGGGFDVTISDPPAAPELSTWTMLVVGGAWLAFGGWRRRPKDMRHIEDAA